MNNQFLCDQNSVLYQNRYCYQEDVDVIIFKINSATCHNNKLLKFKGMNFSTYQWIPLIKPKGYFRKDVIGQDILL